MPRTSDIAHLNLQQLQLNHLLLMSNYDAEYQARLAAVARADRIEEELRNMAQMLVPRELYAYVREHRTMPDLPRLIEIMRVEGAKYLSECQALKRHPDATMEAALQQQIRELQSQLHATQQARTALEKRLQTVQQQLDEAQRACQIHVLRVNQLEHELATAPPASPTTAPAVPEPAAAPPAETSRIQPLIQVMATHGWALWTQVRDELARVSGASKPTLYRWLDDAADANLVNDYRVANEAGQGGPMRLLELTTEGQTQARAWGYTPVEQQFTALIAAHKSAEHVALNLLAAAAFEALGYSVNLFPPVQQVEGSRYAPDLLVVNQRTGAVFYIECERNTDKRRGDRCRKWHLVSRGAGAINLVCPNIKAMERLVTEVTNWSIDGDYKVRLRATHLRAINAEQLWVVDRITAGRAALR
ncbi:MAG: hypothetical protein KKB13_21970 [Chloroflexi bacterium]|nr:hypothetical protein [Chloroflexota bacterium]